MRTFRAVVSGLTAALLALGVSLTALSPAEAAGPKRVIEEKNPNSKQVAWNAFKLVGKVYNPAPDGSLVPYSGKVSIQKKKCGKCRFRTVKKVRTNDNGRYKTRIFAPRKGRWKWRVKVKSSYGYATTKGEVWTLYFR